MRLMTSFNMRTKEPSIPMLIKFMKPVFGFNASEISINGGHLQRQVISFYLCFSVYIC